MQLKLIHAHFYALFSNLKIVVVAVCLLLIKRESIVFFIEIKDGNHKEGIRAFL